MSNHQNQIMTYLTQYESMGVSELSNLLDVSPATIRRQLAKLEVKGLLIRTHGGANLIRPITYELPYEKRAAHKVDAKRMIAVKAKSLIPPNAIVGLSGGTTCTELARQLRTFENLTIVTNAINIALELHGHKENRLMVTGGMLNFYSYELVGNLVSSSLQNVHLDIAFLGASGIDLDFGFSMSDEPEAVAGRAFMATSDKSVIIADSTKLGTRTFARLCSLDAIDLLITDDGINSDQINSLKGAGLEVLVISSIEKLKKDSKKQ